MSKTVILFSFAMGWLLACLSFAQTPGPEAKSEILQQSVTTLALDRLRAQHQSVLDALNAKSAEGQVLDLDDSRVPALLKGGWELAGEWAAAFFENNPTPSKHELEHIFDGFAPAPHGVKSKYGDFLEYPEYNFSGSAVRIADGIYVVQATYFRDSSTGTFMVVARNRDGHFQALWNIKDIAEKHYAQEDEIGRWAHLVRRAYYNGPLNVDKILALSPSANGHARFLVDAYQSADGGTTLAQMSFWEWDGAEAKSLLVRLYQRTFDYRGLQVEGNTVRVKTKEDLGLLDTCGMCSTPRGIWTIRVTPKGVRDMGHQFLMPEIQWADELLGRIGRGEDTTSLADAKVVEALESRIKHVQAEDAALNLAQNDKFTWGMLGECRILRRGQRGAFEVGLDEGRLHFSYELRDGGHYFTHVRID